MAEDLHFKAAHQLRAMIQRRELKPSELMATTIVRIEKTNPRLGAFATMRAEAAMAEARKLDEKVARNEELGALAGLPLGMKDLADARRTSHHLRLGPVQEPYAGKRLDSGRAA